MSPRRLPGEPDRASAVWLAAGDQTSLGGVYGYFPVHRSYQIPLITHKTGNCKKKIPIPADFAGVGKGSTGDVFHDDPGDLPTFHAKSDVAAQHFSVSRIDPGIAAAVAARGK